MDILTKRCIVLQGHLYQGIIFFRFDVNDILRQFLPGFIKVLNKLDQSGFWIELLIPELTIPVIVPIPIFHLFPLIGNGQADTFIQVGQFTQSWCKNLKIKFCCGKDSVVRIEGDNRTCLICFPLSLYIT